MNFMVPVTFMRSFSGIDLSTSFGRSLPHSLEFKRSHISLLVLFRSLSRASCLPDSGEVVSDAT